MKLVFYMSSGLPHPKNWLGIQRMCASYNIEFEYTNNIERLSVNNYDILYCMSNYIDPYSIPENIKVIYGPQLWVIPEAPMLGKFDENLKNRCVFNLLSSWVENYVREFGDFIMPIYHLPLAVDTYKFKPEEVKKEYDCIVYIKRRSNDLINRCINVLDQKSLTYKIFRYGSYNEEEYLWTLQRSTFMLVLDAHESQGFALQEAMSCNVPLLVIDAMSMYDEKCDGINSVYDFLKPKKLSATSVPYWSHECGVKINESNDLSDSIDKIMSNKYTPREYIVRTLSDNVCMKRIIDYFQLNV
jgi:glycosyltransferase involved in cell wall biosynthesis